MFDVDVLRDRPKREESHFDVDELVIYRDNSVIHITPADEGIVVRSEGRQGIMLTPLTDKTVEIITF